MSDETLRHCMVVHARYPIWEPRVQREAEALIDAGYEVDVICLRHTEEPTRELVRGVDVYRLPVSRRKGRGVIVQFFEYLVFFCLVFLRLTFLHFRRHYSAVQVHNPPDFLVLAALIPSLMGAKVILDLHDLMPEFYASRFNSAMDGWSVRLVRWQEWFACRFASHVITVTEPWRQTLIQRGLSADKCTVVMNVADSTIFRSVLPNVRPSKNGRFLMIYHGNISQRYGLDLALRAIAQIRDNLPDIHLTIHGVGAYLDQLQRLTHELELEEQVYFSTEYMPIEELPTLISSADVGLVPYRRDVFTDGILPTKLMEYAALGIPAIVVRTPTIAAYFDETMVEFFTAEDVQELADHIQNLYHNRLRLEELANNIRMFNQRYNWEIQKARYLDLVHGLTRY